MCAYEWECVTICIFICPHLNACKSCYNYSQSIFRCSKIYLVFYITLFCLVTVIITRELKVIITLLCSVSGNITQVTTIALICRFLYCQMNFGGIQIKKTVLRQRWLSGSVLAAQPLRTPAHMQKQGVLAYVFNSRAGVWELIIDPRVSLFNYFNESKWRPQVQSETQCPKKK